MKIGSINFYFFVYKSKVNKIAKAPIYCRLSQGDQTKLVSTSIFIPLEDFSTKDQSIISTDILAVKVYQTWKIKLENLLLKSFMEDESISLQEVISYMKGNSSNGISKGILEVFAIHNVNIKKLVGKEYSIRTWEKYELIYKQVQAYIQELYSQKDISIKKVSMKHLVEFEEYLLIKRNLKQVTVNKSIQRLKKIIRYAIGHEWLDKDPWLLHKQKSVQIEIKYLSKVELDKVLSSELLDPKIKRARDCFVFQCFTGLGYAELKELSMDDIIEKDGILWIKLNRKKTNRKINVPVLPPAKKILESYNFCLPVISNQKYNLYLKIMAKELKIETNISSHLARKTYTSTVLLENNIPLKVASRLLAHTTTKTTEKHYAELSSGLLKEHIDKLNKIYD